MGQSLRTLMALTKMLKVHVVEAKLRDERNGHTVYHSVYQFMQPYCIVYFCINVKGAGIGANY